VSKKREGGSQTDWELQHKKKGAFSELNQQRFPALFVTHCTHRYPHTDTRTQIPAHTAHRYPHTQHLTAHIMSTFLPKKAFATGLKVHITVHTVHTVHTEPTEPTEPRDPRDHRDHRDHRAHRDHRDRTPIIAPDFWDVVEAEMGMDMEMDMGMDMDMGMPMSTEELVELEEYMDELEKYLN